MSTVMIGVDPHKASVSIEVRESGSERLLDTGRFGTDTTGYRELTAVVKRWPQRLRLRFRNIFSSLSWQITLIGG